MIAINPAALWRKKWFIPDVKDLSEPTKLKWLQLCSWERILVWMCAVLLLIHGEHWLFQRYRINLFLNNQPWISKGVCSCSNIFLPEYLFFFFFLFFLFFFTKLNKDSAAVGVKPAAEKWLLSCFRISASIHYASWTLSEVCRMLECIMARGQLSWWISSEPYAPLRPPSAQKLRLTHQPQDKHRPYTSERANFINIFNKSCSNSKG